MEKLNIYTKVARLFNCNLYKDGTVIGYHFGWCFNFSKFKFEKKRHDIDIKNIEFVLHRHTRFLKRHYLFLGYDPFEKRLYLDEDSIKKVYNTVVSEDPVFKRVPVSIHTPDSEKTVSSLIYSQEAILWKYEDKVILIRHTKDKQPVAHIRPEYIEFFRTTISSSLFQLFRKKRNKVYLGGRERQFIFDEKSSIALEPKIRNFMIEGGAHINKARIGGEEINDSFWCFKILHYKEWGHHCKVSLHEEGIGFSYKKRGDADECFIPYQDISFINFPQGLFDFLPKSFALYGIQNVTTSLKFSKSKRDRIYNAIQEHASPDSGKTIYPRNSFLIPQFLSSQSIIVSNGQENSLSFPRAKNDRVLTTTINDMAWEKKHWYNFRGDIYISASSNNMRIDQSNRELFYCLNKIAFWDKQTIRNLFPDAQYNDSKFRKDLGLKHNLTYKLFFKHISF